MEVTIVSKRDQLLNCSAVPRQSCSATSSAHRAMPNRSSPNPAEQPSSLLQPPSRYDAQSTLNGWDGLQLLSARPSRLRMLKTIVALPGLRPATLDGPPQMHPSYLHLLLKSATGIVFLYLLIKFAFNYLVGRPRDNHRAKTN